MSTSLNGPPGGALRVRFLGTGGPLAAGGRLQSGLLLADGASRVLVDCGATTAVALAGAGVAPADLDAILVSHLHGDHAAGLPFLLLDELAATRGAAGHPPRSKPLTIAGPAGLAEWVDAALTLFGYADLAAVRAALPISFTALPDRRPEAVGPATVTAYPVVHYPHTRPHAFRVAWGPRTVAYSGDTGWTPELVEVARDADLFVCEAYTFDRDDPRDMSHRTLLAHRPELSARRIVLTHLGPDMHRRRAEAVFEVAEDGLEIAL